MKQYEQNLLTEIYSAEKNHWINFLYFQHSTTIWIFHSGALVYASVVIPLLIAFWKFWISRYQIENFALTKLQFNIIMPCVIDLTHEYEILIRFLESLICLISILVVTYQAGTTNKTPTNNYTKRETHLKWF